MRLLLVVIVLLTAVACNCGGGGEADAGTDAGVLGRDAGPADSGVADAGVVDSGVPDAGVVDAGVVDAGVVDAGVVDAGVVDAGVVDAGVVDAGVPDAGVVDAGVPDAGVVDSGVPDAGVLDAGVPDAGVLDAGVPDAGMPDAGVVDSGVPDAGPIDSGVPDAGSPIADGGCPSPSGFIADALDAGLPTGLVLWLRADRGVATFDGGAVCRWEDVSGNQRHLTPPGASPRFDPTAINGRPAVVFSTNTRLERSDVLGLSPTQGRTVAVRSQILDTTRRFGSVIQGNRANLWEYLELEQNTFNTVGSRTAVYLTANAYDSDLPTSSAARTHVYSVSTLTVGTALPQALVYAVDGTVRTLTRTPGGNGPSGPGNNLVWGFAGANFTSVGETSVAGFTGGALGEVLVFDHALSASERAAVEAHLGR